MAVGGHDIECDLLVVGGGINGAGIARDAAGRGLCVVLCEKDDLGSHTSSASTKLIHGGLRYLEYYEFALVRKALIEREVLMRCAPHIIRPLRFVMPHAPGQRPALLIRAGLFLYDFLARRELLPGSHGVRLRCHVAGRPLRPEFTRGFVYSDGWVDDARLVVLNAMDACRKGAAIKTRTACVALRRERDHWYATLRQADGVESVVRARCVVNAAGPWTASLLGMALPRRDARSLRLIKGSHIVVKRLFEHEHAYIFQHRDGRIVFAIPYEGDYTLIGTTDLDYRGDPNAVAIDGAEVAYLCELVSQYFSAPVRPDDVVWTYAGVRPLVEDAAADAKAVTRDYRFEVEAEGGAPLLSIFGGKITTFRKLAEEAVDLVCKSLGSPQRGWTAKACLPGGDLYGDTPQNCAVLRYGEWEAKVAKQYPWLAPGLLARYCRAYGTRVHTLLSGRAALADMGGELEPGLYAAEVEYLRRYEWAVTAADILWRRSKLGLHLPPGAEARLDAWLSAQ
ncbi:glycerol-3-phosphate dehydrogenase [Pseudoduganella namucuonensis]|uniref:Glycerol-3-phosphate dehydrogenase n=1 Tax=Pseudoduganella namucuonensis TaxID=1035707 RepID=A0A1I7L4F9_9BURK|nr:glycerol-3-phosphate dehydrogenase [Pseudoduganella namucuonensis]SFV04623.1 homodimeric glycerol 3-phosphate dehydrogenase (quinone) [Pseudoduganella namucuonensis]